MKSRTSCFEEETRGALPEIVAALGCSRFGTKDYSSCEMTKEGGCHESADAPLKIVVACPSLSLQHEHVESKAAGPRSREQVAVHAASLMARQENITVTYSNGAFSVCNHKEKQLLENVYQSFAILVYSRVRAYTTMIARHCTDLLEKDAADTRVKTAQSCAGKKLDRLLNAAHAIHLDKMATTFEVESVNLDEDDSVTPLAFGLTIDLNLPAPNAESRTYKMSIKAPGEIKGKRGCVDTDLRLMCPILKACVSLVSGVDSAFITIDTDELLSTLIKKASEVVEWLAELSTDPTRSDTAPLPRSSSFLTMPPPKPRDPSLQAGLQLLSSAAMATSPPVVSPDIRARPSMPPQAPIPTLVLTDVKFDSDEEDVTQFSVDQCENIVDNIFCGGLDETVFGGPPPKKIKLGSF